MKTFFTLPTDKDFFNRYARLIPALKVSGYFGQVVSGLTEVGVIYTAIYSSLVFFSARIAPVGAALGAVIGTAILEIGLRVLLPYSARAVLFRRFRGLDLIISLIVWIACAVLLTASTLMSFHGSRDVVDTFKPAPKLKGTQQHEKRFHNAERAALEAYQRDSAEIAGRYLVQINAVKAQYSAQISQSTGKLKALEAREKSGQSFTTAKNQARGTIAQLEADQAGKLAALVADQSREMAATAARKTKALEVAAKELSQAKGKVNAENSDLVATGEKKLQRYKGGFSYFTIICHLLLIVSIFVDEVHRKGSGIEQKVVPTQYDFSDSIAGEFWHALSSKFNQYVRERIRRMEENTPPPPLPLAPNELFSLDNLNQPVYLVDFEQLPDEYRKINIASRTPGALPGASAAPAPVLSIVPQVVATLPASEAQQKALEYLKAAMQLAASGLTDAANAMELKADEVLKMYLGDKATPESVATLRGQCVEHLEGKAENPFGHHHRKPIGFHSTPADQQTQSVNNAMRYNEPTGEAKTVVLDGSLKPCERCSKLFKPRTTWHKYCSESCRLGKHEEKHGQAFDPKAYHKSKKGKK